MPGVKLFADTNVVFYSRDDAVDERIELSRKWIDQAAIRNALSINLQVLNELASILFKKRKQLTGKEVFAAIDDLSAFGCEPISMGTVTAARNIRLASGYSWWDCLLLASAIELGCSHFLSEDLQDGQEVGGMTIINPFLHAPETVFARG